ncbi:MAG: GNAT family N-acetyltransferase [Candidatus Acidiferrum sp.]
MNTSEGEGYPRVRVAIQRDVTELTKLINAAFVVERPFLEGDRIDEQGTYELLEKGRFLIAEDCSGMAGCVYCELRGDRGYLGLLAVDPARHGTGLGRKLMAAAEEYFRGAGCVGVDLRVISQRAPLPAFYRHIGYAEAGTAPFAASVPIKVPGHYILMSKQLI